MSNRGTGLEHPRTGERRIIGVLDLGTTKCCCLIAEVAAAAPGAPNGAAPKLRILGVGHRRSRGMKAGVIVDLEEAEGVVRATISQAEKMAGVTLDAIYIGVAFGRMRSLHFSAQADVESGTVQDRDVARVMEAGRSYAQRNGRALVHLNRIGFCVDQLPGVRDPRGRPCRRLAAELHAVTVDDAPLRNLLLLVERCHLSTAGLIATPYASAMACTTEEERRLGCLCLDIGGGTSASAVFSDGHFLFADVAPLGGSHLTFDIARALATPLAHAERIKVLYGTVIGAPSDDREPIEYTAAEGDGERPAKTTRAYLRDIARARVASLVGQVSERLERSRMAAYTGNRVVLTGGASELVGLSQYVAGLVRGRVRAARPRLAYNLAEAVSGPAFSTVLGLLYAAVQPHSGICDYEEPDPLGAGFVDRLGRWLRESF